jgi:hypothetical protein
MAEQHVRECATSMIDGFQISLIDASAQLGAALLALSLSVLLIPAGALRLRCP